MLRTREAFLFASKIMFNGVCPRPYEVGGQEHELAEGSHVLVVVQLYSD